MLQIGCREVAAGSRTRTAEYRKTAKNGKQEQGERNSVEQTGTQNRQNPLGYAEPRQLLRQFAIPSIISMTVINLYNLVDQIFIGWKVGMLGNAATNVAFPLTTICMALSLLIGIGYSARYGLELGRKHPEIAERTVGNAVLIALLCGLGVLAAAELWLLPLLKAFGATPSVLPYSVTYVRITAVGFPALILGNVLSTLIRADGSPRFSMICTLVGCLTNIALDPIFMFGFGMGVDGAAKATVISQFLGLVISIPYFFHMKQVHLGRGAFRPDLKLNGRNLSLGLSNCFTQLAITLVQIVMNNSLTYYGALSVYGAEIPLTAFGIVMKVNSIVMGFFVGIAQGGQPIYSFNYGAEKYGRVKTVYRMAIRTSFVISVAAFAAFEVFPRQILSIFGTGSPLYFQFAVRFMRIFLCMVLVNGIQLITSNFFSAIAMPWKGTVLALCRQTFFLIPLILILPRFFGVEGLMYTGPVADLIAAAASLLLVRHEFRVMGTGDLQESGKGRKRGEG